MKTFEACGNIVQGCILSALLLLLLAEIVLLILQWGRVRAFKTMAGNVLLLVLTYGYVVDLLGSYIADREGQPTLLRVAAGCPVVWLVLAILAGIAYLLRMIWQEEKRYRRELSVAAIRQTLDQLPCGICFGDEVGRIILSNEKMQQLGQMLTGESLQNQDLLQAALGKSPCPEGIAKVGQDDSLYYFPNGTVWDFQSMQLEEPALKGYRQFLAVDVTEIYFNSEKIKKSNEELVHVNEKLQQLYERIDEQIREEETLAMKIRIHDSFGRSLLAVRQLLDEGKTPDMMKKQLASLKRTVQILLGNMQEAAEENSADVKEKAKRLGITLFLEGVYPEEEDLKKLIDQATMECLTNCARHAGGNQVFVKIKDSPALCEVRMTNNGKLPSVDAKEGGGLGSLRRCVEQAEGKMQVSFAPRFELVLLLLHRKEQIL